jgi:hypothetical protein
LIGLGIISWWETTTATLAEQSSIPMDFFDTKHNNHQQIPTITIPLASFDEYAMQSFLQSYSPTFFFLCSSDIHSIAIRQIRF